MKGMAAWFPEPKGSRRWHASGRIAGWPVDQQAVRALSLGEAGLGGRDLPVYREPDGTPPAEAMVTSLASHSL